MKVWAHRAVGDPILDSNVTRWLDFAQFMAAAIESDELIDEAPAITGCQSHSAFAHSYLAIV